MAASDRSHHWWNQNDFNDLVSNEELMKKQLINNVLPSGMGKPALRALAAEGITKLEELSAISKKELLKLHGIGPKAIRIIKEELQKQGMDFAKPEDTVLISDIANQKIERRK